MKTSELVNRLLESITKFGDRDVVAEMQITKDGEPIMGRRVPLMVTATAKETKLAFQFGGFVEGKPTPQLVGHELPNA